MKKISFIVLLLISLSTGLLISQQANAVPTGKAPMICVDRDENGIIISLGNTCIDGKNNCIENLCP